MAIPDVPGNSTRLPDVDENLSPEQEDQLRTSPAWTAWHWQRKHGCENFDCLRCRVGRALAVLSKATMDGNAAADVLCGLIPDLVEYQDEVVPVPDTEAFQESCRLLIRALDNLEQCGVSVAIAMRTPTEELNEGDTPSGRRKSRGVN